MSALSEQLAISEMDSVETVIDGITYKCGKPDERGKIEVFADDVWFLVRYINTLRADALLVSEKAVETAIRHDLDLQTARASLAERDALLGKAGEAVAKMAKFPDDPKNADLTHSEAINTLQSWAASLAAELKEKQG